MNPKIEKANYYMMWEVLKMNISAMTVEGEMIHLSDLESAMNDIEDDEKM